MYYGMGFYIVLSIVVFYLFVKIASLKYGLLNTLANTKSSYANDKVSYERKSVFFPCIKRAWTILSSYMAVLNAGLGVILLCVFSICFLFNSVGQIGNSAELKI